MSLKPRLFKTKCKLLPHSGVSSSDNLVYGAHSDGVSAHHAQKSFFRGCFVTGAEYATVNALFDTLRPLLRRLERQSAPLGVVGVAHRGKARPEAGIVWTHQGRVAHQSREIDVVLKRCCE